MRGPESACASPETIGVLARRPTKSASESNTCSRAEARSARPRQAGTSDRSDGPLRARESAENQRQSARRLTPIRVTRRHSAVIDSSTIVGAASPRRQGARSPHSPHRARGTASAQRRGHCCVHARTRTRFRRIGAVSSGAARWTWSVSSHSTERAVTCGRCLAAQQPSRRSTAWVCRLAARHRDSSPNWSYATASIRWLLGSRPQRPWRRCAAVRSTCERAGIVAQTPAVPAERSMTILRWKRPEASTARALRRRARRWSNSRSVRAGLLLEPRGAPLRFSSRSSLHISPAHTAESRSSDHVVGRPVLSIRAVNARCLSPSSSTPRSRPHVYSRRATR